jgi:DNA-binding CsgD family transcriptional regulator
MRCSVDSLKIDRQLGDLRSMAVSLDHVGKCARALGDLPAAWEAHAESLGYRREVGDPRGLLTWLEGMTRWLVDAGRPEVASMAIGAIEVTRTASTLPLHLHEEHDHDEAERSAREALGEARYIAAVAKGRWVALDDMVTMVREAAEARMESLLSGGGRSLESLVERYGLTPREQEVLVLLGKRYADKEIADELCISPRTVARHVTGIFTKLDVHSRREAAALIESLQT